MSAILICQLMEMRLYIERNVKLKFKGCNHPNQTRLLNRPRRQNASPDFILGPTRVNPLAFSRSSSMTQLPTIRNTNGCHNSKLNSFRGSTSRYYSQYDQPQFTICSKQPMLATKLTYYTLLPITVTNSREQSQPPTIVTNLNDQHNIKILVTNPRDQS